MSSTFLIICEAQVFYRNVLHIEYVVNYLPPPPQDQGPPSKGDPFYEAQENHNLIGVANVFLEALFYDVKLDYHVPIISQQGEVLSDLP